MNSQQNTNMNMPHFFRCVCMCVFFSYGWVTLASLRDFLSFSIRHVFFFVCVWGGFLRMGDSGFFARLFKFLNTPRFFLCVCVCVFSYEWVTLASLRDFLSFSIRHVFFFLCVCVCVCFRTNG